MKLCIAEKPSVAKDIAKVLGANTPMQGYFEGNGYWVTWTFGHLCTLKEPHDYGPQYKSWNLIFLPIIPQNFGIKLISNGGVQKQFKVIENLVSDCEEVINCGDAPRRRIDTAMGDWLLVLNAPDSLPRNLVANRLFFLIGRVQTPTLAMLVQRQKEIDAFQTEEYWELKTTYREVLFNAAIDRLKTQEKAEKGLEYLKQHPFEIVSFEIKEGKEKNPRLLTLPDYRWKHIENMHTTYPRVDTTYLSESLYPKIGGILRSMHFYREYTESLLSQPIPMSKTVFDDTKVTDHHAIIPTEVPPSQNLSKEEKLIYDLVARRFIAVFYPECKISNTLVEGKVGTIPFKANGKQILEPGWRMVYAKDKKESSEKNKEEEQNIPDFKVGESGEHIPMIHQGKTSPPKRYTEATFAAGYGNCRKAG
ncbi:hypothetical protein FQR65_LT17923 [Abscondita terminalis]|nr:hypothetical protein FQR65_LT17923 [Abscondita terminalis]